MQNKDTSEWHQQQYYAASKGRGANPLFLVFDRNPEEAQIYNPMADPQLRNEIVVNYGWDPDAIIQSITLALALWRADGATSQGDLSTACAMLGNAAMAGVLLTGGDAAFGPDRGGGGGNPSHGLRPILEPNLYKVEDGGYYFQARLNGVGRLELDIKTKIGGKYGQIVAKDEFKSMINHFGKNRVQVIRGRWDAMADGLGDNLAQFNRLTAQGVSPETAALQTWTGTQAKNAGYTKARVVELFPEGDVGSYEIVVVDFTQ